MPVYSLNPNTYLDMAVDELGLWVIHADAEYGGNLVITKLEIGKVLLLLHIHSSVKKVLSLYIYIYIYNKTSIRVVSDP